MQQELLNFKNQALAMINEAKSAQEIKELRLAYLGRKGKINELVKQIPKLKSEEKSQIGRLINEAKDTIEEKIMSLHREKKDLASSLLEGTDSAARVTPDELVRLLKDEV